MKANTRSLIKKKKRTTHVLELCVFREGGVQATVKMEGVKIQGRVKGPVFTAFHRPWAGKSAPFLV